MSEEEEVPETAVLSQESTGSDSVEEPDESEQSLQVLARCLELPLETVQTVCSGTEEGQLLLLKMAQHLGKMEEYENTVEELTQALSSQRQEGWCKHGAHYMGI